MNNIMSALLARIGPFNDGTGMQFAGNGMDDFGALTAYIKARKGIDGQTSNTEAKGDSQKQSPLDRIKAAFSDLKDMHKDPTAATPMPSWLGGAQFGLHPGSLPPMSSPMAATPVQPSVPMPQPRPAEADAQQPALMSFFQRNAALQKDPSSGDYIDPNAAATANAQPGIMSKLFS